MGHPAFATCRVPIQDSDGDTVRAAEDAVQHDGVPWKTSDIDVAKQLAPHAARTAHDRFRVNEIGMRGATLHARDECAANLATTNPRC